VVCLISTFSNEPYSFFSKNARNNSAQAYDQAIKQSELPARLEAVINPQNTTSAFGNNTNSASALPSTSSAFSNTNTTTTSAFGQPAFGQSAFGQPSFGQPVQNPSTSTTSTAPTGAFGQPLNNPAPLSAFGQPLQAPATSSVFGQPSALGQSTTSSFIKPASGAFSAFSNTGSSGAFSGGGNNATPATNTAGGGAFSAFATHPSAPSLAAQNAPTVGSVFGQPSFGQPTPSTSSVPTTTSVFGNPTPASTSVFGTPSAFGVLSQQLQPQQAAPVSAFEANTTPSAFNTNTSNPLFGQSSFGNTNNNNNFQSTSSFSGGPTTTPFGNSLSSNTAINSNLDNSTFTTTTPSISVDMQSGASPNPSFATTSSHTQLPRAKSIYKPDSTPYDQQIPLNYKEALPKSVVQAFENQKFEWGDIPEWVPPVEVR